MLNEDQKEQLREFCEKIDRTSELKQGWDSYDGDPPTDIARKNCSVFLLTMASQGFLPHRVSPTVIGGMAITWKSPNYGVDKKKFFIEFHNSGRTFYMLCVHKEGGEIFTKQADSSSYLNNVVYENIVAEAKKYLGIE